MKSDKNSVVAIFDSHDRAEDAIRELQKSGFDMKKLSIIGKDYHTEENVVGYTTGDRMKYWGKLGAFWCRLFFCLGSTSRILANFSVPECLTKRNQIMTDKNSVVAIFDSHDRAEDAIRELQKSGFDMKKLSIVGKDYHTEENVVGYYNAGDRMKYWGKLGAFWGGFWGLLFGSAFFWVPGIGPLLVAGPLVVCIVGGLEGAVMTGGLTALGAAFTASAFRRTASSNTKPR